MRILRVLSVLGAAALLLACEPALSLHPVFTEKDVVFEPALLGAWGEKDEETTVLFFQRFGENAYEITLTEDNQEKSRFKGRVARLGNFLFLDALPAEPASGRGILDMHRLPAHSISRLWIEGDTLFLAPLEEDWVEEKIKENKAAIAHMFIEDRCVITAPTADLQRFLLKYAEDEKAFPKEGPLQRREGS